MRRKAVMAGRYTKAAVAGAVELRQGRQTCAVAGGQMVPLWVTRQRRPVARRLLLDSLGGQAVNSKATGFTVLERLLLAFSTFFYMHTIRHGCCMSC
jgi:hypothetical protein